ncbi:VWA domain-containing protein [Marinobacter sp. M216]|uniref:VWA domain-containing protein n=1 Tax=Marinobacter albus TaxID=3030833 RepID=A0ABT7HAL7_9GAMM|nr:MULTISPECIES: VWA domain-containing protein [unclassified Marinobacter]MBW7470327.1 VWA domain-containing protein [Marinobacter sp. F4218]MDK9557408.1 VWA domain-containing protein [Marinobacter sp. M216]
MTDFHFLRPFWLLLILSLPLIYITLRHLGAGDSGWSRVISDRLLAPVIRHGGAAGARHRSPLLPVCFATTVLAVALAGPAWREAPTPLKQPGDSLVIALDLSLSMLATDVEPDRLTLAKRKIRDILDARQGSLNGLIVFAADAHVVAPLTDDSKTIEGMLDVLDPVIMPAPGNRADLAIARAKALLTQGAPGKGRILLISDEVPERYHSAISKTLSGTDLSLSTLVVGTEEGGPIPLAKRGFIRDNGEIVIARAAPDTMADLAAENGGASQTLTLDETDIQALELEPTDNDDWQESESGLTVNRWQDDGYWLLWLTLPLLLLGWRRGAFAIVALTIMPLVPQPAQAQDWAALWQREDQRAPDMIREDPDSAAERLEDPEWRGSALYKSGQFDQAIDAFSAAEGARSDYNRGNALARAGKLEEAIAAYDKALAQNPDLEDADYNRTLVKKLLEQQQQEQENQQESGDSQSENQDQSSQNQEQQQNPSQSNESQNSGQQPQQSSNGSPENENRDQQESPGESEGDRKKQEQQDQTNGGKQPAGKAEAPAQISERPLSQGQEQWLRRVPDNPGGLLKRKFLQQYQERQTPSDEGDTPW